MYSFKLISSNISNYSMDLVWENAQDMEHVGTLHDNTNIDFKIINMSKSKNSEFLYDQLSYYAVRKFLGFLPIQSFGYRKIISKFKIIQSEFSPLLKINTRLISTIEPHKQKNKCYMIDYVEVKVPWYGFFLKNFLTNAIKRHAKIQCMEDESFRERRKVLKERNINLRMTLFNTPEMDIWEKNLDKDLKSFDYLNK